MPFQVKHDATQGLIKAAMTGDLDRPLVAEFFTEVLRVATETGCGRVLSDLREARIVATTADIYWMAQALAKKKVQALHRRAIVVARDQDDYAFWETVCSNLGHRNVRVFEDYDAARRWVLESE